MSRERVYVIERVRERNERMWKRALNESRIKGDRSTDGGPVRENLIKHRRKRILRWK